MPGLFGCAMVCIYDYSHDGRKPHNEVRAGKPGVGGARRGSDLNSGRSLRSVRDYIRCGWLLLYGAIEDPERRALRAGAAAAGRDDRGDVEAGADLGAED